MLRNTSFNALATAALLAATVSAHGMVTSPPSRQAGTAMAAVCGQSAVDAINADPTIPIENMASLANPKCQSFLCRGAVFEDNKANVQQFKPGQTVRMTAVLPIPHKGPMNVSIVNTATNTVLGGGPLLSFDVYADESLAQLPANNTDFSVTIPKTLAATDCTQGGQCALQWHWFGTDAQQTYQSCVDFVMV